MSPVEKAVAYIIEKAQLDSPAERAETYRIAAELTPDEFLSDQLLAAASAIEAAEAAQLSLDLVAPKRRKPPTDPSNDGDGA